MDNHCTTVLLCIHYYATHVKGSSLAVVLLGSHPILSRGILALFCSDPCYFDACWFVMVPVAESKSVLECLPLVENCHSLSNNFMPRYCKQLTASFSVANASSVLDFTATSFTRSVHSCVYMLSLSCPS